MSATGHLRADRAFREAASLHERGQIREAAHRYESILAANPGHVDALHLLGVAHHQLGDSTKARVLIEQALAGDRKRPYLHYNLGEVLRALGDMQGAERCYRRALELDPKWAEAANNLGMALCSLGRPHEAVPAFRRAQRLGMPTGVVLNNLGMAQHAAGDLDAAIASFRKAVASDPQRAEAHSNLGAALTDVGDLDEANRSLETAIAIDPSDFSPHFNLARNRYRLGDLEEAEKACRNALEREPENLDARVLLGSVLRNLGKLDEAEAVLRAVISDEPDNADAHNALGTAYADRGDFVQAQRCYRIAIQAEPANSKAYSNLATAQRFRTGEEADLRLIETALTREQFPDHVRGDLHFALGKAYDDCKRSDQAFAHFVEGNKLRRARINYDAQVSAERFARLMRGFDADYLSRHAGIGADSDVPVFVVGMPRSGTTLVEQILAAHPQVHGAGEQRLLPQLTEALPGLLGVSDPYPECAERLDSSNAAAIAERYLSPMREKAPGATRITDKLPGNFMHVGLIATLMPRARVVLLERNPLDVCLSLFFTAFGEGVLYSYELHETGAYFRGFDRLCRHWGSVLGGTVYRVNYEALVQRPEPIVRALLDHCELPWDERCLRFHEVRRPVSTASNWQVRQPMYRSSIARWKRYESFLAPLREGLGPELWAAATTDAGPDSMR